MKKAILIVGIIWIVLSLVIAVVEITYGIGQITNLSSNSVDWKPDYARGTANIIIGAIYVVAAVLSFVTILKRNSNMSKKAGIALGVVSIVFGATVPGILFIVDSAKTRQ